MQPPELRGSQDHQGRPLRLLEQDRGWSAREGCALDVNMGIQCPGVSSCRVGVLLGDAHYARL
jgi:hypothetical protein